MIAAGGVLNNLQPFDNKNSTSQHKQEIMLMCMLRLMMVYVFLGLLRMSYGGREPMAGSSGWVLATMSVLWKSLCGRGQEHCCSPANGV